MSASATWCSPAPSGSSPRRQWNEYSQYEENYNAGARNTPPTGYPGTQEGFTCLNDPYYGGGAFTAATRRRSSTSTTVNPERWSNELRLSSKAGERSTGWGACTGRRPTIRTTAAPTTCRGCSTKGPRSSTSSAITTSPAPIAAPRTVVRLHRTSHPTCRPREFANISFDVTDKLNVEAGAVYFHSYSNYVTPFVQLCLRPHTPSDYQRDTRTRRMAKFGVNYKITEHVMVYGDLAQGFRPGGTNAGDPSECYTNGVTQNYTPDTLNNYEFGWKTTSLDGQAAVERRGLLHGLEKAAGAHLRRRMSALPATTSTSAMRASTGWNRTSTTRSMSNWHPGIRRLYRPPRNFRGKLRLTSYVNERLPFAPYFSWSWNARYQSRERRTAGLCAVRHGRQGRYVQRPQSRRQEYRPAAHPAASYTISNLRFGITPEG